jgi:hypothetical protein
VEYYGILEVGVVWEDVYIKLQSERNGAFSFDLDSNVKNGFYSLSAEDKSIKISVDLILFYGEEFPIPRGLILNQSTDEDVKSAYPVEASVMRDSPTIGSYSIAYKYANYDEIALKQEIEKTDLIYIRYYFKNEILSAIEIGPVA